jgi:hypothetical protein
MNIWVASRDTLTTKSPSLAQPPGGITRVASDSNLSRLPNFTRRVAVVPLVAGMDKFLISSQIGTPRPEREGQEEYKKILQQISPLVGDAGVSIEVFADCTTTARPHNRCSLWARKCSPGFPTPISSIPALRKAARCGNFCAEPDSRQHYIVLLAVTSSGRLRCDEKHQDARLRFPFCPVPGRFRI